MRPRCHHLLGILVVGVLAGFLSPAARAQSANPLTVALMTGFLAGPVPGLSILENKLQAEFGSGMVSQVFPFNFFNPGQQAANTGAWILSQPSPGPIVVIGHSLGAESAIAVAANQLAMAGIGVDLLVSLDYVALSSPCQPTMPTAPSTAVTTLNYFQESTGFCPIDWRSSSMVLGAAENVSMEFLFDDSAITHTSIDCDERVHQLVIDRIRELLQPEPYPGTGDDLALLGRVDVFAVPCQPGSGVVSAGILAETPIQQVLGGSRVTLRAITPEHSFTGSPFALIGEFVPTTGLPGAPVVPGFFVDPAAPGAFVLNSAGLQVLPSVVLVPLAGGAYDFEFCWPVGLAGNSLLLQSVVLDPAAMNGIFATSSGLELRGL